MDEDTCQYCNGTGQRTSDCTMEYDRFGNLEYATWTCEWYEVHGRRLVTISESTNQDSHE